jgi:hypothetical protein
MHNTDTRPAQLKKKNETRAEFSSEEMKLQRAECRGKILLCDNTGHGAIMLRPIRLQCVGARISSVLLCAYLYI